MNAPTKHAKLLAWVDEITKMTQPDSNLPSKPTQPTASTTGQGTATAKSLLPLLKPSNLAMFALFAGENSQKALSSVWRNSPTDQ